MASGQADKRMSDGTVWELLAADPDRYIYPAMRHGATLPLPAEIAAGMDDVAKRDGVEQARAGRVCPAHRDLARGGGAPPALREVKAAISQWHSPRSTT